MNKELGNMIEELKKCYGSQIGRIEIITNGNLLPKEEVIKTLKACNVTLRISDYSIQIPYKGRLKELCVLLDQNEIEYSVESSLKWTDFMFPDKKCDELADVRRHMLCCAPEFHGLNDGKFYYCHVAWSAEKAGLFTLKDTDSIDLASIDVSDNNAELYGKIIRDEIVCIDKKALPANTICFILTSVHLIADITEELRNMGITEVINYMELCEYHSRNYFDVQKRNQIAVYTCVVGDYDKVQEPISLAEGCDYYIISDKEPEEKTVYKYMNIADCISGEIQDNTRKNRFCKINAHEMFPQYRYSVYFDGNIILDENIVKYLENLPQTRITMLSRVSYDSVYAEAFRCMLHGRDDKEKFERQVEKYWLEGMPDDFGLVLPTVMVREHNHPICKKLMTEWWNEISMFSKRDMISFPYVLWKNGYTIHDVNTMSEKKDVTDGQGWIFRRDHEKRRT